MWRFVYLIRLTDFPELSPIIDYHKEVVRQCLAG